MIPLRVSLKNFLSFGDEPAVVEFADGDPLWVIRGPNGVGKSAVFDAITYALYGQHRGGKNDARELVRHGANAFEVVFDFEFAGEVYRVRRTRTDRETGRTTTQQLSRRDGGEFRPVRAGDSAGADTARDIERWVTATLGLGFEAFTKSVLLRQGKADELFNATGPERRQVLKEIMGFERFEALSKRVHEATRQREAEHKAAAARLTGLEPVTADELKAAAAAVTTAEAEAAAARDALTAATARVERAVAWEGLERRRADLDGKLSEADERAARGRQIRERKRALDDLTAAVPVLEDLFAARGRVTAGDAAATAAAQRLAEATAARDAAAAAAEQARQKADGHRQRAADLATRVADLGRQVEADEALLKRAAGVEAIDAQMTEFQPDLDGRLADARADAERAETAHREAAAAHTRAEVRSQQVAEQLGRFSSVENDPVCSYCGQAVDAAHAAKERVRLDAEGAAARTHLDRVTAEAAAAGERLTAARAERDHCHQQAAARDKLRSKRDGLTAAGPVEPSGVIRGRLETVAAGRADAERDQKSEAAGVTAAADEAARHGRARDRHEAAVEAARRDERSAGNALATARGEEASALARLPAEWPARLPGLDAAGVADLAVERDRLAASGVVEAYAELEQDDIRRAGWEADRAAVTAEIETVPGADRVPADEARVARGTAEQAAEAAGAWWRAAVTDRDALDGRRKGFEEATAGARASAEGHRLHKKLDDLLGGTGLQLDLVREAEGQIVALANETLDHLSDGELSLEEDAAADAGKAFDLRARRAGGDPIGVSFLSGSQRFRVAVAVALAVGRFAAGRARPLEAVVIDEGFGSLDRDGLRAMADELKRLQQRAALRRVILVSHQDEFTDQFPVGYELTPGETGTTARPFRRG